MFQLRINRATTFTYTLAFFILSYNVTASKGNFTCKMDYSQQGLGCFVQKLNHYEVKFYPFHRVFKQAVEQRTSWRLKAPTTLWRNALSQPWTCWGYVLGMCVVRTHHHSIQAYVGKGTFVNRGHITLKKNQTRWCSFLNWRNCWFTVVQFLPPATRWRQHFHTLQHSSLQTQGFF